MMKKKTALEAALHFLKFRPRSIFEIQRKLRQKRYSQTEIEKTIKILEKEGLVNDLEFAKMWIRNRNLLKPTGKKLLFLELRKLGVEKEIIEKALLEDDLPEINKAEIIFEKKKRYFNKLPSEEFNKKMIGYLSRRGFSWDVIKEVLRGHSPS